MPFTQNGHAALAAICSLTETEPEPDYPNDQQFGEAALWLHSAGGLSRLAGISGDLRMKLAALEEIERAVRMLGFHLAIKEGS